MKSASAAALFLLGAYWLCALAFVDRAPTVHEDEPWIASTAWQFATRGVLGSAMFAGMDGMDTHYYEFMPLYPVTQAFLFRVAGVGLFQARLVSIFAGALTLALTFALGRRLFNARVGALAMVLLLVTHGGAENPSLPTGILFLDVNRMARYDAFVPLLGLAALYLFLSARTRQSFLLYGAAGFFAGLAGLAHLYGAFWVIALGVLALWENARLRVVFALAAGFCLAWLPYILYILSDLDAWSAQLQWAHGLFDVFNPGWYLNNLSNEFHRYGINNLPLPAHFGVWFSVWGIILAGAVLSWRAFGNKDSHARILVISFAIIAALFALLLNRKMPNYALILAPLAALMVAWGIATFWQKISNVAAARPLRFALLLPLILVAVEGMLSLLQFDVYAATAMPFENFSAALHSAIPSGARVLGLHSAWFGFQDTQYRNILAMMPQGDETSTFVTRALDNFNPQDIVIDPRLDTTLRNAAPTDILSHSLQAWMQQHDFVQIKKVYDPMHGTYQVFAPAR